MLFRSILTPLIKQLTEAALNAEIENYLEENPKPSNRRNGYSRKTVKSSSDSFELETPRDRTGDFEPQLVKKNQTKLSEEIDSKVISLFALGMSYRDIQKHIAGHGAAEAGYHSLVVFCAVAVYQRIYMFLLLQDYFNPLGFVFLKSLHYLAQRSFCLMIKLFIFFYRFFAKQELFFYFYLDALQDILAVISDKLKVLYYLHID